MKNLHFTNYQTRNKDKTNKARGNNELKLKIKDTKNVFISKANIIIGLFRKF